MTLPNDFVDMTASGYDWICPNCGQVNQINEYQEIVICQNCQERFAANQPVHAYE